MIQLIAKNGNPLPHVKADDLTLLHELQPRIDSARWGRTPFRRRCNFQLVSGGKAYISAYERRDNATQNAAHNPKAKQAYTLCIDEGTTLAELLPLSNTITLDLQESFGVRVTSFKHVGDKPSCKAVLTVLATAGQIAQIRVAYPRLKLVLQASA